MTLKPNAEELALIAEEIGAEVMCRLLRKAWGVPHGSGASP